MTHIPEDTFDHTVATFLRETLSPDRLDYQARLDGSGRVADFLAVNETPGPGPSLVHAVEVENDFDSAVKGTGQALMYAGHFHHGIPVVALPADHVDQPEFTALDTTAPVTYLFIPTDD